MVQSREWWTIIVKAVCQRNKGGLCSRWHSDVGAHGSFQVSTASPGATWPIRAKMRSFARLGLERREHFEFQILEADFHRAAGVDLQAEDAAAREVRVGQVDARFAV